MLHSPCLLLSLQVRESSYDLKCQLFTRICSFSILPKSNQGVQASSDDLIQNQLSEQEFETLSSESLYCSIAIIPLGKKTWSYNDRVMLRLDETSEVIKSNFCQPIPTMWARPSVPRLPKGIDSQGDFPVGHIEKPMSDLSCREEDVVPAHSETGDWVLPPL